MPHPTRFALHKMLVGMNRGHHDEIKKHKDFHQASQLILACAMEMPDLLKQSIKDLQSRGKKWKALYNQGIVSLNSDAQDCLKNL